MAFKTSIALYELCAFVCCLVINNHIYSFLHRYYTLSYILRSRVPDSYGV